MNGNKSITAMNIAPVDEMHAYDIDEYEDSQFQNVIETSTNSIWKSQPFLKPPLI
jgi:hypothetical protein